MRNSILVKLVFLLLTLSALSGCILPPFPGGDGGHGGGHRDGGRGGHQGGGHDGHRGR